MDDFDFGWLASPAPFTVLLVTLPCFSLANRALAWANSAIS